MVDIESLQGICSPNFAVEGFTASFAHPSIF